MNTDLEIYYQIKTKDQHIVTINLNCALLCSLLKEFNDSSEIIPLEISFIHLQKIRSFLIHHTEITSCPTINGSIRSLTSLRQVYDDWYYNFGINFEENDLLEFLKACHYLDCNILVEFISSFVAAKLLAKTPKEVEEYILIS